MVLGGRYASFSIRDTHLQASESQRICFFSRKSNHDLPVPYTCHGQELRFVGDGRPPTFNRESLL